MPPMPNYEKLSCAELPARKSSMGDCPWRLTAWVLHSVVSGAMGTELPGASLAVRMVRMAPLMVRSRSDPFISSAARFNSSVFVALFCSPRPLVIRCLYQQDPTSF